MSTPIQEDQSLQRFRLNVEQSSPSLQNALDDLVKALREGYLEAVQFSREQLLQAGFCSRQRGGASQVPLRPARIHVAYPGPLSEQRSQLSKSPEETSTER